MPLGQECVGESLFGSPWYLMLSGFFPVSLCGLAFGVLRNARCASGNEDYDCSICWGNSPKGILGYQQYSVLLLINGWVGGMRMGTLAFLLFPPDQK